MDKKVIAIIVAAVSIFMWFQPFNSWGGFYQTGEHWGGIAYGLLILPVLFSVAVWVSQRPLALVFSIISLLLTGKFLVQIGSNVGWGLIGIAVCSIVSVFIASNLEQKAQVPEA